VAVGKEVVVVVVVVVIIIIIIIIIIHNYCSYQLNFQCVSYT
jgi:uncharacterized integral membrane protein